MRKKVQLWQLALVICILGFFFAGGKAAEGVLRTRREREAGLALAQQVQEHSTGEKYAPSGLLMKYDALYRQNQDLAGWLSIPGTATDCPVMNTPDDPEKYLRMAFDGSYAISGSLFIGEGCTPDGSNVILFGHNMKNGTMLGTLPRYTREDYAKEHPVFHLDTLTQEREYQVIAAFFCTAGEKFPYGYTDLTQPEVFEEFLDQAEKRALWSMPRRPQPGTRLATLSTCSYRGEEGRFVVIGAEAG